MTTSALRNREALLNGRADELRTEAVEMVDGHRAFTPQPLHVVACVLALESAEQDVVVARHRLADADAERAALINELGDAQRSLAGLKETYTEAADELATLRLVAKAFTRFIRDVDQASMLVGDYVNEILPPQPEAGAGAAPRGD